MSQAIFHRVTPEIPATYYGKLFDYIYVQYLLPQKQRFSNIARETTKQSNTLGYTVLNAERKKQIHVEFRSGNPFELNVTPLVPDVSQAALEEAKEDVLIALQFFTENTRKATVYFAWREGEEIVPEAYKKPEKSFNRFFLETQILFFVVFIVFGMAIFLTVTAVYPEGFWSVPLVLIGIQLIFVVYANRLIARSADWHITEANPTIHFLEYYLPVGEKDDFNKAYPRETLLAIKTEIYHEIIAKKGEVDIAEAQKVFQKYGVPCKPENLSAKKVNVYQMVKDIADKFRFPTPEIVVSNTMVPNAAASGPSPKRGLVLITTGLLVQLNEEEIRSVLGHEFGHLRGRDPLILYGLVSAEFLFRFYVLLPVFPLIFSTFLFFVYFWGVMVLIFFIAKFFEARADLVSAMMIGTPKVLAGSLQKIGFQRLLYERTPSFRMQEWLGLDPHPPIYFRIARLQNLQPGEIKHPLLQSMIDVTRGFIATLKG
jgi:heat shock protein HtpX